MTHPEKLIKGNCYFTKSYFDKNLLVPRVDTYIYVEKEIDDNGKNYWIFQDAESYYNDDQEQQYLSVEEDQIYSMIDIQGLTKELKELEAFHPLIEGEEDLKDEIVGISKENSIELDTKINEFVSFDRKYKALTISIKYKEDGLAIDRVESDLEMTFYIKHIREPDKENKIREIFSKKEIKPNKDYLAQQERIRIVSYSLPLNENRLKELCKIIFTEVYEIKEYENFVFSFQNQ